MSDAHSDNNELIERPLVSIVLPVYNAGEYLRPCLDTLVNQTLREIEIICVLDCPTDGSDKIVEEYALKDSRIVVIKNKHNLHIGESRNVGIRAAKGEYIGFSDHDDTHELNMYEALYSATKNNKVDIVLSGKFVVETNLQKKSPILVKTCLQHILNRESTPHITPHLFKNHIKNREYKFIDTKFCPGEDILFFIETLCQLKDSSDLALVPEILYHHLETGFNTVDSSDYSSLKKVPLLIHNAYDIIQESPYKNQLNKELWTFLVLKTYSPFVRDIHNKGFFRAKKYLKAVVVNDEFYCSIVNDYFQISKKFTIPKMVFAIYLKHICHFRKFVKSCR